MMENKITAEAGTLRPVVIDGSNVAMQLGRKIFATRGILICARYFIARGHRVITFVPQFRRNQRQDNFRRPMKDQHLLDWMEDHEMLVFTPSRLVTLEGDQRRRIVCYDDYNIVQYAHETGGVIVSKDQYRDVIAEHPEWADTVRNRLIMFSWVGEMFMVAEDPFGRHGPRLSDVLLYGEEDRVAAFVGDWNPEKGETLLKEIDEILTAPPPAPVDASDQTDQPLASEMAELMALSEAPRYGFARRDHHGWNHRSRRWMTQNGDAAKSAPSTPMGFSPIRDHGANEIDGKHIEQGRSSSVDGAFSDLGNCSVDNTDAFMQWFVGEEHRDEEDWDLVHIESSAVSTGAIDSALPASPPNGPTAATQTDATEEVPSLPEPQNVDRALFEFFCGIFPTGVVEDVMKQYEKVHDMELLSNLLADALVRQ